MAKTLEQIQKQIDALQREAATVRKREVGKVIDRIRVAIQHYQLTPQELFGAGGGKRGRRAGTAGAAAGKSAATGSRGRKTVGKIKFRDEASGRGWTGHGRRPQWFVDALAAGKKPEDLAVK
jgi:DNA-binding protein H-NS